MNRLNGLKRALSFAVGMVSAMSSGWVWMVQAQTAPTAAVQLNQNSIINFISHAHGCEKMATSPGGSPYVFSNGIKNVNTSTALQLACTLTSPGDGFDPLVDYAGVDVLDQNKQATGGSVTVKACFTTRAIAGTGCSAAVSTLSASTGFYGIKIPFPTAVTDLTASRYLDVTLPPQDVTSASVVRAYGYYDASFGVGGGGGGDLTALQASVSQHTADIQALNSAIATINTTLTSHANAIAVLNSTVTGGNADLTALETEVSGNTTAISSLNTTVDGHTSSIASINGTLSTHGSQLATLQSNVSSVQGNMSSTQSSVSFLQSDMSTVQSNVSALWSEVNTHSDQFAGTTTSSLKSNIDGLWSSVNTHSDQFAGTTTSSLKANIDALWSDSSTQSTQISSLNSTVSSQGVSLTRHHKRLSALEVFSFYRVFVTSTTYSGNMGGIAGADANCQARATAAGLGGTWAAWVSGSQGAISRLTLATAVRYINLYGDPVAIGKADLTDGALTNAILYDEFEVDRTGSQAWTGTTPTGATAASNCSNWSSSASTGVVGVVGPLDGTWTQHATPQSCATMQRLYCIEQGT